MTDLHQRMYDLYRVPDNAVKLQGLPGWQPAKKAIDLRPGDVLLWNFGSTSTVTVVTPSATGKSVTVSFTDEQGKLWRRIFRAQRLVAVKQETKEE